MSFHSLITHFPLVLNNILFPGYKILLIHLPLNGYPSCFQDLTTINKVL
jgi:hypothetical protein